MKFPCFLLLFLCLMEVSLFCFLVWWKFSGFLPLFQQKWSVPVFKGAVGIFNVPQRTAYVPVFGGPGGFQQNRSVPVSKGPRRTASVSASEGLGWTASVPVFVGPGRTASVSVVEGPGSQSVVPVNGGPRETTQALSSVVPGLSLNGTAASSVVPGSAVNVAVPGRINCRHGASGVSSYSQAVYKLITATIVLSYRPFFKGRELPSSGSSDCTTVRLACTPQKHFLKITFLYECEHFEELVWVLCVRTGNCGHPHNFKISYGRISWGLKCRSVSQASLERR